MSAPFLSMTVPFDEDSFFNYECSFLRPGRSRAHG